MVVDELRTQLSQVELRASVLQDEKNKWESYFESESLEFSTPEGLAKALIEARIESATLLEKAGRVDPVIEEKERRIQKLEVAIQSLKQDLELSQSTTAKEAKTRQRLERQRTLATKEAQFLRDQLKSFSTEETIHMSGNFDEQKNQRIQELEDLLESYKQEVKDLLEDATAAESGAPVVSKKRPREEADDERLGELSRKNRQLQGGNNQSYRLRLGN